ncbi:MAG TPA: DUF3866 family protein, partial [Solirubrobacterales bacterium]|nr:DUF3866 family protein [Solirubrobacterales bacterium]
MPRRTRTGSKEAAPPVLVLALRVHLAPAAWAAARARPGLRLGYLQTAGGGPPRGVPSDVTRLRESGFLAGDLTAGPAYGEEHDSSLADALDAAAGRLGWEAIVFGPGPDIDGLEVPYGHGAPAALESANAALALGLPTLLSPRLSGSDPRPGHRGLSE